MGSDQEPRNLTWKLLAVLSAAAVMAAGCAIISPPATSTPAPTETAVPSAQPSSTVTPLPTLTSTATLSPVPPTRTPLPQIGISDQPAETGYLVPITVQLLTQLEAMVSFELERPSSGYLLYRPDFPDIQGWWAEQLDESAASQQILLFGLTPGQRYVVQVGLGNDLQDLRAPELFGSSWGSISFQTQELGKATLRVGVIGDSGFGGERTKDLVGLMTEHELDFVLHLGDLAYRGFEDGGPAQAYARKYFRPFAPILQDIPIYPVLGNHEYDRGVRMAGVPFFSRAFPVLSDPSVPDDALGQWYSFDYAGVQFIMLDSQAFYGMGGRQEQTAWLEERLSDPNYRLSIPVFHIPPYTSGKHRNDGRVIQSNWNPLFEAEQIPLVVSGHDHNYERITVNGTTYLVSGGGSAVLYGETGRVEGSQVFHQRAHFVLLEITSDQILVSAIDQDGSVLDSATIPMALD